MIEVSAAEIASTWRQLEHRYGCGGLATSWTWVETWLRHYGDLVPHRFVVAERNGPCGIALVTSGVGKRRGPFNVRTLHLGTAGEPDAETVRIQYNRLLAEPSAREDMASALLRLLATSGGPWDELRLDGFEPGEALPLLAASGRFATNRRLTYVTDLSTIRSSGRRVLEGLDPHAAKKLRRSIRLIEQSHGSLAVEWATTAGAAREIFDEMVSLHEARWRADGLPGVFASKRFTGFNRDLIESLFPAGNILLARVRAGDTTLGCDYSFIERNRVLGYQWGVARLEDSRPSPGLVTGLSVMQEAMDRGFDEYDWLSGDVLYKRQLSTTTRELLWARMPRGLRIQGIYALEEARRRFRGVSARLARPDGIAANETG